MKRFTLKVTIKKEEQRPKEEVKNEETTPFSCNYCGLSFKQVDHIIEHINGCYFQPNPRVISQNSASHECTDIIFDGLISAFFGGSNQV